MLNLYVWWDGMGYEKEQIAYSSLFQGKWLQSSAGIGAGCDSFYEYLLKSYVIFGKPSYLHMFNEVPSTSSVQTKRFSHGFIFYQSYTAIQRYMKQGDWHFNVHMATGTS